MDHDRPGRASRIRLASSSAIPMSITKWSTKKPGSKSLQDARRQVDSAQQPAAPPEIEESIRLEESPALCP
jgi:hypothetical protein